MAPPLPEQVLKQTAGRSRTAVIDLYHAEYTACFNAFCTLQSETAAEIEFLLQQLELERLGFHQLADWNRKYRHDLERRRQQRGATIVSQRTLPPDDLPGREKADG